MAQQEDMCYQASLDGVAPSRFSSTVKVAAALFAGAGLGLVTMRSTPVSFPEIQSTSTNLIGGPTLRRGPMTSISAASLPGASPWKELAIAAIESSKGCQRDVSMNANSPFSAAVANLNGEQKALFSQFKRDVSVHAKKKAASFSAAEELPGVVSPWGFWDPLSLSADISEGRLLYFREAELKHGRVCMLATLGFLVGERFHPLFGGDVDLPSALLSKTTSIDYFWPVALLLTAIVEFSGGPRFNNGYGLRELIPGLVPGDLGFDPLGLKGDVDSEEFLDMQNREILHGRLAMISAVGMIAEELVTGEKLQWIKLFLGPGGGVSR